MPIPCPLPRLLLLLLLPMLSLLVSCESNEARKLRLQKETAEAQLAAQRWKTAQSVLLGLLAAAAVAKLGYSVYSHYSKSNISRRLIAKKRDYQGALRLELKARDYLSVEGIIKSLRLPQPLQGQLNLASASLSRVCHLFSDPRNTYIPAGLKSEILASAQQTYEGLFSAIQRVKVLQESHLGGHMDPAALSRVTEEARSIHLRLEASLKTVGAMVLENSTHRSQDAVDSLQAMLAALKEADAMLAGQARG